MLIAFILAVAADDSCVRISPDAANPAYTDDDFLPEGRTMGQFVYLPDGTLWMGNGAQMGTAGYGTEGWGKGQSYADVPIYRPGIYDPNQPKGSRWNWNLASSTQERLYHSTVVLLKDGSLLISGSNPNADVETATFATSYSVERWYPKWFNEQRPGNQGFPEVLSYGGDYWTMTLNTTDETLVKSAKVNVIRGGFSTHAIQFGQRFLELMTSYEIDTVAGTTTLYVTQMPPNAALFTPGPAMLFLVVDGVPSHGKYVMVGSGQIGTQPTAEAATLPTSGTKATETASASTESAAAATGTAKIQASSNSNAGVASVAAPLGLTLVFGLVSAWVGL